MTELPKGWRAVPLEEVLETTIGGVWGGEAGSGEVDVDVLRVTELKENGLLEPHTAARRSVSAKQVASRSLREGDIILEKSGGGPKSPVGRVGRITRSTEGFLFSNFMQLLRPNPRVTSPNYLFQFLVYFQATGQTAPMQTATTNIRNIKMPEYLALSVPVPPLAEQDRIIEILEEQFSRLDSALASIKVVREKAQAFRRSLLRSLTCQTIYISDQRSVSSVTLAEVGKWGGGGTPSKSNPDFWNGGTIPWVTSKDMKQTILSDSEMHITPAAIEGSSARITAANSVAVVARSGILERTLPVALVPFPSTYNQDLKVVTPTEAVLPKWLLYALQANGQEILQTCRKAGTTVASIEWPLFLRYEILLPSVAVDAARKLSHNAA